MKMIRYSIHSTIINENTKINRRLYKTDKVKSRITFFFPQTTLTFSSTLHGSLLDFLNLLDIFWLYPYTANQSYPHEFHLVIFYLEDPIVMSNSKEFELKSNHPK